MTRLTTVALLLFAVTPPLCAQTNNAATSTNAAPVAAAPPNPFPKAILPAQVITQAEGMLAEYPAPGTTEPDRTGVTVRQALREKDAELKLFAETTSIALAQNPSLDDIRSRTKYGEDLAAFPAGWAKSLTDRTKHLADKLDQIKADQSTWQDTLASLKGPPPAPPELLQRANDVLARLAAAKAARTTEQNNLLKLEDQVTDEGTLVTTALNRLGTAHNLAISQLFHANAPPIWSGESMSANDQSEKLTFSRQWDSLMAYAAAQSEKFVIHGLLIALFVGCFFWLRGRARGLVTGEPGIAPAARIFEMPIAAGLLLAIIAGSFLYYPIAPHLLFALLGAIALVPSVMLLRHLVAPRLFPVLYALVAFFFLEQIRSVASLTPEEERTFLLAELVGAFSFLAWLILSLRRAPTAKRISPLMRFAGWAAFLVLVVGWLAEIFGYTRLASLICIGVQRSATLGLALYAGIRILDALLFILTRLRPISQLGMMQGHRAIVLTRAQHILAWAASLWWVFLTLEMVPSTSTLHERLFGSSVTRSHGWFGHYQSTGSYGVNFLGKLLVAALIVWAVIQISKFGRFVLETEFYPRLRLSAGVPYAISTTLHYAMLVLAFIGATVALGIDMTKFTILVSALGVGVGFGLQNIINNFVSGLILLFERPVKIGDSIQVGADTGTVERIGIRASVLRTVNGSELILPNGSLISGNVTNWTLSSRERIILIPLNVPRGPDLGHLIGLLTATAAAHPKVLKNPAPQVVAQTLGANLGLELRAWTEATEDWTLARSEIVLAVSDALARENIALA